MKLVTTKFKQLLIFSFVLILSSHEVQSKQVLDYVLDSIGEYNYNENYTEKQIRALHLSLYFLTIRGMKKNGEKDYSYESIIKKHYNRNSNMPSQEVSYEAVKNKNNYRKLNFEKSVFHQIGTPDILYEKYVSLPDEKLEYVFAIDNSEAVLVKNPINAGTYNYYGQNQPYLHAIYDVIPWILWGSALPSEGDTTTFVYRLKLTVAAALYQKALVDGDYEKYKKIKDDLLSILKNCDCDGAENNNFLAPVTSIISPLPIQDDRNDDNKEQITNKPPTNNDNDEDDNFPYLGFIAGKVLGESSLFTGNLYTGKEGGGDAPVGQRGEARLKAGVNTVYSDNVDPDIQIAITSPPNNPKEPDSEGFIYTRWGSWDGAGKTIPGFTNKDAERGYYVIGRSTHIDDIPRRGSAEYNGEVKGVAFNGESIGGTVILNADFENKIFNGTFHLQRANGTSWVKLQTNDMPYSLDDGRNFEITFSNNGAGTVETPAGTTVVGAGNNVRGSFFGKAGEEVAGDWAVYNVPDAVGGADGVFRAKK